MAVRRSERRFSTSPLCNFSVVLSSFIAGRGRGPEGSEAVQDGYPREEWWLYPSLYIVTRFPVESGANHAPCGCQKSGSTGSHGCSGRPDRMGIHGKSGGYIQVFIL